MNELPSVGSGIRSQPFRVAHKAPAMLVRSRDGRITMWSPSMQQRYGFTADEARGKIAHQLLRTIFWKPLHEVEAVIREQKVWWGGLIHHRSDGRPVITAHHWYLHMDVTGGEPMVTELHSDIVPAGGIEANQLADVMMIVAHDLSQPLTAIADYISGSRHLLQPAWPDRPRLLEACSASAAQIDRIKDAMLLFREMTEGLRSPPGSAETRARTQPVSEQYAQNDEDE